MQINPISSSINYSKSINSKLNKPETTQPSQIHNNDNIVNYMQNIGNLNKSITFGAKIPHLTDISKSLSEVGLFDNSKLDITSRVLQKIGVEDIEFIGPKTEDVATRLYIRCKNFIYNMTLGKISDDVMTGLVSKEYNNGKNELFMLRGEFFETNKSKKLQLSFMPIVQEGLEDSSKVKPKHLKEISGEVTSDSVGQEQVAAWQKTGESYSDYDILGGLFGGGTSHSVSYSPSLINKRFLNTINMGLQLSNSDIRKNVTFSVDKESGLMTEAGVTIGKNFPKITKKYSGWDIVTGPYGYVETPKNINITEEGIDPASIKALIGRPLVKGGFGYNFSETLSHISNEEINKITDHPIKEAEDLRLLISVLGRMLNNETLNWKEYSENQFYGKNYVLGADWDNFSSQHIRNLIEISRNLLRAAEEKGF